MGSSQRMKSATRTRKEERSEQCVRHRRHGRCQCHRRREPKITGRPHKSLSPPPSSLSLSAPRSTPRSPSAIPACSCTAPIHLQSAHLVLGSRRRKILSGRPGLAVQQEDKASCLAEEEDLPGGCCLDSGEEGGDGLLRPRICR
jgi:hypothetical protein